MYIVPVPVSDRVKDDAFISSYRMPELSRARLPAETLQAGKKIKLE